MAVENLNFKVILDTEEFNDKIKAVEQTAKMFNSTLTESLTIHKSVERATKENAEAHKYWDGVFKEHINSIGKQSDALKQLAKDYKDEEKTARVAADAEAKAASERERDAQNFPKLLEQLRKLDAQSEKMASSGQKAFDWSHPINQAYMELDRLLEILKKIQERQNSGARIQYSDEYVNSITQQAEGALRAIQALEEAQKRLSGSGNGLSQQLNTLTSTNVQLLQMREHYKALEADPKRAAEETKKMYGSQQKVTQETKKTVTVSKEWEAAQKRIAENLAKEAADTRTLAQVQADNAKKAREAEKIKEQSAEKQLSAQQRVNNAIEKGVKAQQKHNAELRKAHTASINLKGVLSAISQLTGVYFGLSLIRRFVSSMIQITGEFQSQKVALGTMLGDLEKAEKIYQDLYKFSSSSVYRFSELTKYAKQLAAFNIDSSDLLETTKMLGDVASGVGVSMDRIILAYGHVKSSGFLRGIQLRSLTQNGVPILEELAKMMEETEHRAISLGEVFDKMTKRQIDFAMVEEAFRRMTSEGGKFYEMQEAQAQTLKGQVNILKGRWENLMNEFGQQTDGVTMTIIKAISESISSLDKFKETLSNFWEAGSPIWSVIGEVRDFITYLENHRIIDIRVQGLGGDTSTEGGEGFSGGGEGGGGRGGRTPDYDFNNILNEIRALDQQIAALRKKALGGLITAEEKQTLLNIINERQQLANEFKAIMGEKYDHYTNGAEQEAERKLRETIQAIQKDAAIVEKIKQAYEKLREVAGDENAKKYLGEIFGEKDFYDDIEGEILRLTNKLRKYGEEGVQAAEAIESRLGLDKATLIAKGLKAEAKAAEDAQKALNKYLDALEKWANATQDLSGTGAAYGISKAIANYKKSIGNNDTKFWEMAVLGTNAYKNDSAKQAGGIGELMSLWAKNRVSALGTLREDVLKYVDEVFKEEMNKKGFDLTNLNDKNLSQLLAIKKAIESIEVPQEVRDMLNASPEGAELLKQLEKAIEEYKKNYNDNTLGPETFKKVAKGAKYAASQILSLAESIGKLSTEAGESIEILGDFLSTVAQGFAQGGPYGIVIGAVAWMAKKVIELVAEENAAIAEFERNSAKAAAAYNDTMNDIAVKNKDTVFGENALGKIGEYIRIAKEYKGELEPIIKEFNKFSFGAEYIDKNGVLNLERVLADIENGVLSGDGAERLKTAITKYKDAIGQLDGIAENVFGDIASSAADKIVEGWIEAGDAALDYADILDDVAKAYSKMLIKSMISKTFLDPITEDVKKAFTENRYEDAMAMIAGAMDGIAESAPMFEDILRAFDPYFSSGDSDANSLGAGIKSITEETASLLASYINAMRADLSYMRGLQERGWGSVELIGQAIPTLNDYMAQIAATNFDIAQSNQSILSELQSVIGAEGTSGSIVRVQMA